MNFLVYKITNTVNNKEYIGIHRTRNIDDGYMGSGKHLKRAIQKYGKEKFTKTILYNCSSEIEMINKEKELVTEEYCSQKNTYNICLGGHGGFWHITSDMRADNSKVLVDTHLYRMENDEQYYNKNKERFLRCAMPQAWKSTGGKPKSFLGKKHSNDTKRLMSETKRGTGRGKHNSQYGTMWITNGSENRKINKLDSIPEEWYKGRTVG